MKSKRWLILLAGLAVILLAGGTGVTRSAFTDTEQSIDNTLTMSTGIVTLLNDGFEGTPWDANWDGNGATSWIQDASKPHTGSYDAYCDKDNNGYLTSDDLDASAASSITVSFWFNTKGIEAGDILVQLYNGGTYNTWYDITNYPTYVNNAWCYFSEVITDPQYFISSFRLRFDGSGLVDKNEECNIDDVLITITEQW